MGPGSSDLYLTLPEREKASLYGIKNVFICNKSVFICDKECLPEREKKSFLWSGAVLMAMPCPEDVHRDRALRFAHGLKPCCHHHYINERFGFNSPMNRFVFLEIIGCRNLPCVGFGIRSALHHVLGSIPCGELSGLSAGNIVSESYFKVAQER